MPTPSPTPYRPILARRQAVVVWSALASAVVVAAVLSFFAPNPRPDAALRVPFLLVTLFLGIGEAFAGSIVLRSVRRKALASPAGAAALPGTLTIVACAQAVGFAFLACVAQWVTKEITFLGFAAAAFLVVLRWFPGEARWARLGAPDASRGSTMMRE